MEINHATGLLIIEVIDSNPNGDPDRESDPRQRHDNRGEISPVSVKRKQRDLVDDKKGPVWIELNKALSLKEENYGILESRGRDRNTIIQEINENKFLSKYWDARIFGNTFLEEGQSNTIQTGAVQYGLGVSISPIRIERLTTTNKAGVEQGKDRGMAPLAYRIVQHGVYCMPFFINGTAASKTECKQNDIDLMLKLIPYIYSNTASYIRSQVTIRHAFYVEHNSPIGTYNDFTIIDSLKPKRIGNINEPSSSWQDYHPLDDQIKKLDSEIKSKTKGIRDLMKEM